MERTKLVEEMARAMDVGTKCKKTWPEVADYVLSRLDALGLYVAEKGSIAFPECIEITHDGKVVWRKDTASSKGPS